MNDHRRQLVKDIQARSKFVLFIRLVLCKARIRGRVQDWSRDKQGELGGVMLVTEHL